MQLSNAIYSVISPEGCASILWRDPQKTLEASEAMKLTAQDLLDFKIIDEVIQEPLGGAHRDKDLILKNVRASIKNNLQFFQSMTRDEIFNHRKNKFLSIGRSKGFIDQSKDTYTLRMKQNFIDIAMDKFVKNKNYLIILFVIFILILSLFYLL